MANTSHLDYMQCEMLVKVSGNTLHINSEVLRNLKTLWKGDDPVVVLSVLGQPKSRKTFWMNVILSVFGEKYPVPKSLFPNSSDEDDPRYSDFHGQEGILVWKHPQRIQHFGGSTTWLFLDIWQEYPRMEVYKKLVDFCFNMSTTVIFSENCDLQNVEYWSPSISTLSSGYNTIIDAIQLHFLIQTDEVPSISFHPETPSVTNCVVQIKDINSDFFNNITGIRRTSELFQSRSTYVTTSYVSSAYLREISHLGSFNSQNRGLISQISRSILQHCSLNQFKMNRQVVLLPQIVECFEKCIEAINEASTLISSYVEPLNQFRLTTSTTLKLPSESTSQQYSEDEDWEMKDLDDFFNSVMKNDENKHDAMLKHGTKLSNSDASSPFVANETITTGNKIVHQVFTESGINQLDSQGSVDIPSQFHKYYKCAFQKYFRDVQEISMFFEESDLLKYHQSISKDIEATIGTVDPIFIEYCFNEVKQDNSNFKCKYYAISDQVNKETSLIVDELCTRAKNNNIVFPDSLFDNRFQAMNKNLAKGIPMKWHKALENIISSQKKAVFETISKIFEIVAMYKDSFRKHFKLCLTPQQFEDHHMKNILAAKLSVNWEDSSTENLNMLLDIITNQQKKVFHENNSKIYANEEMISKQAYQYALERFKFYLDENISSTTLSENQLQKMYNDTSTVVLSAFMNALEEPYNELWLLQQRELKEKLNSLQMTYAQKNRSHLRKVDLVKKESMEIGLQCYREEMRRNLSEIKLSTELFNHVHTSSFRKSVAKFHDKLNQIDKNIWKHWEDQLKNKLCELEKRFVEDNKNKKVQSTLYSEVLNSSKEQVKIEEHHLKVCTQRSEGPDPKQYGIGLYIDSQQVYVGVYVNQDLDFSDSVQSYEPLIGFAKGEIFVGEEVLSRCRQKEHTFNIFELLCFDSDNLPYDVNVSGKSYELGHEEMLALYFHRIRRNTECMIERNISSCCVAVTGLLTSGSKQLLKASLQLAGFQTNILIPCTTAMAISYSLKFRNGDLSSGRKHNTLLVYTCSKTVEVAVVEISEVNISTNSLCGDLNVYNRVGGVQFWRTLEKRLHRIFQNCAELLDFDRFVMCNGNPIRSETDQIKALTKLILKEVENAATYYNVASFELIKDVLRVAAVIDANSKKHPENAIFRLPTYLNIHPYRLELKRKGKSQSQTLVDFNSHGTANLNFELSFKERQLFLEESAQDAESTWQVAKYKFTMPTKYHEGKVSLLLNDEGNLVIETNPEDQLLYVYVTKSITFRTLLNISNNIVPLLSKMDQKYAIQFPVHDQPKTMEDLNRDATSAAVTNCQEIVDLKKSLATLITNVEHQLNNSSNTTDAVKENIRAKIRKCELIINESDAKLKQLQIEKNNLERASKLIKL